MFSLEKARQKRDKKRQKKIKDTTNSEKAITGSTGSTGSIAHIAASLTAAYEATLAFIKPYFSYLIAFFTFIFIIN